MKTCTLPIVVLLVASFATITNADLLCEPYAITTVVGRTGFPGPVGAPSGIAVTSDGTIFVAAPNYNMILKVSQDYEVTTFAGSGQPGSDDGTGIEAKFNQPFGVTTDTAGNVYVADTYNSTIRKISANGVVTTLAGMAGIVGSTDGIGSDARFNFPQALTVDNQGYIYVADTSNSTIRKISPDHQWNQFGRNPIL
jgi:streptogramin lyase